MNKETILATLIISALLILTISIILNNNNSCDNSWDYNQSNQKNYNTLPLELEDGKSIIYTGNVFYIFNENRTIVYEYNANGSFIKETKLIKLKEYDL